MTEPLDPLIALAGGALIGIAAAILLLLSGRIAGISGLLARATGIADSGPSRAEAALFVAGLPLGAILVSAALGAPAIVVTGSMPLLITAGLLVGYGTRLGNGCTSGHGVCGIARLSPRSIAATATFMGTGFVLVGVMRHLAGI